MSAFRETLMDNSSFFMNAVLLKEEHILESDVPLASLDEMITRLEQEITAGRIRDVYERKVTRDELHAAIAGLPDKQAKRIYAHLILGMNVAQLVSSLAALIRG